jgi:hypothetical protein
MGNRKSWTTTNLGPLPQELVLPQKPPNRKAFHEFGGAGSPRKEAQGPHV